MKKVLTATACLYVVLLVVCTALMVAVHTIPLAAISAQLERSLATLEQEGMYPMRHTPLGGARLDNFTDCYMLNVAACADASRPVDAAMRNYRYRGIDDDMVLCTRMAMQRPLPADVFEYGKYWHGYQVTLRPLLTVLDYGGVRKLNSWLLGVLLVAVVALMWRRLGAGVAASLVVALLMAHCAVVPWSLQFSTCHYVMLVAVCVLLSWRWLTRSWRRLVPAFFGIGAMTAFLDFFTTPIITLGVPLAVAMMLMGKHRRPMMVMACIAAAWAVGYALMWASKWGMASVLAGYNPLAEAADSIQTHSLGTDGLTVGQMWLQSLRGWFAPTVSTVCQVSFLILLALAAVLAPRGRRAFTCNTWLLAVAALPLLWYVVATHHSFTHSLITWRMFEVTWFAMICFLLKNTDLDKLKAYVFSNRKS